MEYYFGWVGVGWKIFWVGGGGWRSVGMDKVGRGWVHCLIMPISKGFVDDSKEGIIITR